AVDELHGRSLAKIDVVKRGTAHPMSMQHTDRSIARAPAPAVIEQAREHAILPLIEILGRKKTSALDNEHPAPCARQRIRRGTSSCSGTYDADVDRASLR